MVIKTLSIVPLLLIFYITSTKAACKSPIIDNEINQAVKNEIVDKHNKFRAAVANGKVIGQPKGVNFKKMEWDEALAKEAQKLCDSCTFKHVAVHDDRWEFVGQNLFKSMSTASTKGPNFTDAVTTWFDEQEHYRYGNRIFNHYTQVVWAESEKVGCGYSLYRIKGNYPYQKQYICNYGPGGNILFQFPYEKARR